MRVEISTLLDCPPERAWQEVHTSRLLRYVTHPLQAFIPIEPSELPIVWEEGKYLVGMRSFGFIPLGRQWINITMPTADTTSGKHRYQLRDNGSGQIASKWDHIITLRETEDGSTHYTDTVELKLEFLRSLFGYMRIFSIVTVKRAGDDWFSKTFSTTFK